jgi:hypothetical protein
LTCVNRGGATGFTLWAHQGITMPSIKLSLPIKTLASAVLAWSVALAAVHAAGEMPAGPQSDVINGENIKVGADN